MPVTSRTRSRGALRRARRRSVPFRRSSRSGPAAHDARAAGRRAAVSRAERSAASPVPRPRKAPGDQGDIAIEQAAEARLGQPLDALRRHEIDDEAQRRRRHGGAGHDADAADLEQPGDGRRRAGDDAGWRPAELGLIVGDEAGAAVDQAQRQIRLAAARRSAQQDPCAVDLDTGSMSSNHERFRLKASRRMSMPSQRSPKSAAVAP